MLVVPHMLPIIVCVVSCGGMLRVVLCVAVCGRGRPVVGLSKKVLVSCRVVARSLECQVWCLADRRGSGHKESHV